MEDEIHKVELEFYNKAADFMDLFFKFQAYVEEVEKCQENMEAIKDM